MKRRDFLQLGASAGGMLLCGGVRMAMAQQAGGPYWLFVEANGGWDTTGLCDPKGAGLGPNRDINNYDAADIGRAGNIRYAPPPDSFANNSSLFRNSDFFNAHFERLVVINGIDYGTNSHSVGQVASWTGTKALNYPSIAPLIASELAPDLSLPFLTSANGASSITNNLVPRTLINGGDLNAIRELAYPNRRNVFQSNRYHSDRVRGLIDAAARARRQRQMAAQRLERLQRALAQHDAARNRDVGSLRDFVAAMGSRSSPNSYVKSRSQARNLFNQAQTAFAGFESGAAQTAQIRLNGFDTHSDHDARHHPRLMDYLAAIDNIIDDAMARGIGNDLIIVMASDFARTNTYNSDNGKDHWPHTSVMVWAGPQFVNGNKVVGATDDMQVSRKVNPSTLALDNNGIWLTPEYIHQALRNLAGIDQNPAVTANFPFTETVLPIFS